MGGFTRLEDGNMNRDQSRDRWGHDVNVHGGWMKNGKGNGREGGKEEDEVSLQEMRNGNAAGIKVRHEITVTSEAWDYKDRVY